MALSTVNKHLVKQELAMNTQTVEVQATIHCNRCDKAFEAPKELTRDGFCGTKAARINEPCTCPHCCEHEGEHKLGVCLDCGKELS